MEEIKIQSIKAQETLNKQWSANDQLCHLVKLQADKIRDYKSILVKREDEARRLSNSLDESKRATEESEAIREMPRTSTA